jgi:hypothetical protein
MSSFVIECDELDSLINESGVDRNIFLQVKSTGFDGATVSAAIVAITTAGIAAIAKVAVAAIIQKSKSKLKVKIGRKDIAFELEAEGITKETEEKIIENLKKYLPEKEND